MHHDCPIKKSHCQFANQVEWKLELIAANSLSLLGTQNKNIGNALQSDVTNTEVRLHPQHRLVYKEY